MFSNRLYQAFGLVRSRSSAVSICFNSYHSNVNGQLNLAPVQKIGSNILSSSKCRSLFINSLRSSVRQYSFDGVQDSVGEVHYLRGVRSNFQGEVTVPSPFQCGTSIYKLTKVLNRDSFSAMFEFMKGFEQGFIAYMQLIRQRNINDLDRDWLLTTAQEDSRAIIQQLPEETWETLKEDVYLVPFCLGYKVHREQAPAFVDTAILYPVVLGQNKMLWHLVFTRKFGEAVLDSWTIKNVAVYILTF